MPACMEKTARAEERRDARLEAPPDFQWAAKPLSRTKSSRDTRGERESGEASRWKRHAWGIPKSFNGLLAEEISCNRPAAAKDLPAADFKTAGGTPAVPGMGSRQDCVNFPTYIAHWRAFGYRRRIMPSQLHEALLLLFRNRPMLAAELLRDALHVELLAYTDARIESAGAWPREWPKVKPKGRPNWSRSCSSVVSARSHGPRKSDCGLRRSTLSIFTPNVYSRPSHSTTFSLQPRLRGAAALPHRSAIPPGVNTSGTTVAALHLIARRSSSR